MSEVLGIAAQEATQRPGNEGVGITQEPRGRGVQASPSHTPERAGKEEAGAAACRPQTSVRPHASLIWAIQGKSVSLGFFWQLFDTSLYQKMV